MERTFAVLLASKDFTSAGDVADTLRQDGFSVVAQDRIPGEELAEAGLEIGAAGSAQRGDDLVEYTVWVLEKDDAVRSLNDLKAKRSVQPSRSILIQILRVLTASKRTADSSPAWNS